MYLKTILIASIIGSSTLNSSVTTTTKPIIVNKKTASETAKNVLLSYLKAGDNSDVNTLKTWMHENYRVIFNDKSKNEIKHIDKSTYLDLIQKKIFGGKARTVEILSNDSMGEAIANFTVKTSSESGVFYSYFSLAKTNGKWLIIQDLIYQETK